MGLIDLLTDDCEWVRRVEPLRTRCKFKAVTLLSIVLTANCLPDTY